MQAAAAVAMAAAALGLTGCNDDSGVAAPPAVAAAPAPAPTSVSIGGTAAVGAPIVGASVSARCTTGAAPGPVTTDASGKWTMTLGAASALPCAVQVSGGTVGGVANAQRLHSYASAAGVVNVTPVTDLTVALAAAGTPATWFDARDAAHPPALAATLEAARNQVVTALTSSGYTLPAGTFDPLATGFSAATGDVYDGLLDAFARSLAASGTSYTTLLNNVLTAGGLGGALSLPAFGVGTPGNPPPGGGGTGGGQAGSIALVAKNGVQPADLATLVGSYAGTWGSLKSTGQAAVVTTGCSIDVTAAGRVSVTAGGRTIGLSVNGDVGDQIVTVLKIAKAFAFDFGQGQAMVEVVRGYVALATATDTTGEVTCNVANPHASAASGSSTVASVNGATAADFDAAMVGNYSNGTCNVTLSADGTLRVVTGSVDVKGQIAGDEQDTITVFPTIATEVLQAQEVLADGRTLLLSFTREGVSAALGRTSAAYAADVLVDQPRPAQRLANCQGLIKS